MRLLNPIESLIATGMRWIVGKSAGSTSVAASTLHRELKLPPVSAYCAGQRIRGFTKYSGLRTWIADLVNHIPDWSQFKKWTWCKRTLFWGQRFINSAPVQTAREESWKLWENSHGCASLRSYKESSFDLSRKFLFRALLGEDPGGAGEKLLLLARVDGLRLKDKVMRSTPRTCPICKGDENESSLTHLLIQCSGLDGLREAMQPAIIHARGLDRNLSDCEIGTILLGGEARGRRLPGWVVPCPKQRIAYAHCVAAFLRVAVPKYYNELSRELSEPESL